MFNPMQINNMMNIVQQIKSNPNAMLKQAMQANPQLVQMLQGANMNDPRVRDQVCHNLCMQMGIDYNTAVAQFNQLFGNKF